MNRIFNVSPRSVAINMRPGCYFFDNEAAIGKSYLGNLLRKLNESSKISAYVVTYTKDMVLKNIIQQLQEHFYEIIFFDRLDLYITKDLCSFLASDCTTKVYLLDIKNLNKVEGLGLKYAELILDKDKIEVISI